MKLTAETIREAAFSLAVYSRGLGYLNGGRVKKASVAEEEGGGWTLEARVQGRRMYAVEAEIGADGSITDYRCTCEAAESFGGLCKHCVAALLYARKALESSGRLETDGGKTSAASAPSGAAQSLNGRPRPAVPVPPRLWTDVAARALLSAYASRDSDPEAESRNVLFVPTLLVGGFSKGVELSFTVGFDRQYVVKSLGEFIDAIDAKKRVAYGKGLSFVHSLGAFTPESREYVRFVKKWRQECRLAAMHAPFTAGYYPYHSSGRDERSLKLSPDALDDFFESFKGRVFSSFGGAQAPLLLSEDAPEIAVEAEFMPDGALKLSCGCWSSVYAGRHVYVLREENSGGGRIAGRTIARCGGERSAAIADLMKAFIQNKGALVFAAEDVPAFCSSVLPEIEAHVSIIDRSDRLKACLPEKMTPHLYLDAPARSRITGVPVAEYGGELINMLTGEPFSDPGGAARGSAKAGAAGRWRDVRAENRVIAAVGRVLRFEPGSGFYVEGDGAVCRLMTEDLEKLRAAAELHISDRLKRYALRPPFRAGIGVSLSGGLLQMEIDSGGLPPEQLAAILEAYREKRKYFRLKDGSFLRLEGEALDEFSRLAEGLQLTDRQLAARRAEAPAFRALYLDGLFGGRPGGLAVKKDEAFNKLAQAMRDLGKKNCEPPETLCGILRGYQEAGYRWLRGLEDCSLCGILADDMGLGKSLQLIALMLNRYNSAKDEGVQALPSLIACPASLILNWKNEFAKFAPSLPVRVVAGSAAERRALISGIAAGEVVITSYDLLKRDAEHYAGRPFHYFAIDEAQYIKNQNTKCAQAVKLIECRQRFALTGTPIENRLSELWSIFDFLMPGYLYGYARFRQKFELPVVKNEDEGAREQLRRLISPFILRRLKTEVLSELPPKVCSVVPVRLEGEQRSIYDAALNLGLRQLRSETADAKAGEAKLKIFALLTRLRQLCCDPSLCYEGYDGPSAKLEACLELLAEAKGSGQRALLFSQFASMLDIIRKRLDEAGISSMLLRGSTPKEKRLDMAERFNAGEADVFLISLKAGGTGLNLTGASLVIHYDPWWNMAAQEQATDRAHRIGQTRSVQVYKLIAAGTIEERILSLQEKKSGLASIIEGGGERSLFGMSVEALMELLESR